MGQKRSRRNISQRRGGIRKSPAYAIPAVVRQANAILNNKPIDVRTLKSIAQEQGLELHTLRRRVWPLLLGLPSTHARLSLRGLEKNHRDVEQVARDVNRCAWRFANSDCHSQKMISKKKDQMSSIVNAVLAAHPEELHYYQGYHDIASVLVLVLDQEWLAFSVLEHLSLHHIKDYLRPTLASVIERLSLLYPLLKRAGRHALVDCLNDVSVEPYFAISWLITWFAHDISKFAHVTRLFDLFLSSHCLMPLYFGAALMIHFESDILNWQRDYAVYHSSLLRLPEKISSRELDRVIRLTLQLQARVTPDSLHSTSFRFSPLNYLCAVKSKLFGGSAHSDSSPRHFFQPKSRKPGRRKHTRLNQHERATYMGWELLSVVTAVTILAVLFLISFTDIMASTKPME